MSMFKIHPANLDDLREKLEKMQRRARKLSVAPIVVVEHGVEMVDVKREMPGGAYQTFQEPRLLISVEGDAPKLAGWALVAKVEWLCEERLVSCVPGQECPVEYRTGDFGCDHCKTDRRRNAVFVLRHDDGRHVQVGRNCICDFLGGVDPEMLLARGERLLLAAEEARECEGGRGYPITVGTLEYLCATSICVRRLGWLARGKCMEGELSTSDHAWDLINPPLDRGAARGWEAWVENNRLEFEDRDRKAAEAALEWAQSLPVDDDSDGYLYNLGVACRADYVTFRTRGLVASALTAHLRELGRLEELKQRREEDAKKARGWVGEVKQRMDFENLTVKYTRYIEGRWGTTTLVVFEDEPGNWIKWFASDPGEIEAGDVVTLKATVKEHGEYKGVKETVVTRGKIQ